MRKSESKRLDVNGLAVEVVRKPRRRISLTIYPPDGRVRVAGPVRMGDAAARELVIARWGWIEKHRARVLERAAAMPPAAEFVSGERHFYQGRAYQLDVVQAGAGRKPGATIEGDTVRLTVRPASTKAEREKTLLTWYRNRLVELIPPVLARWEIVTGVEVMAWGVKRMKTKWGTCNPRARRIWISLELAKKPTRCLDYIMVHELTHILEASHNARFKGFMNRFMPDWRAHRKDLSTCL